MASFAGPKKSCCRCKVERCCSCSCVRGRKTCQNCLPGLEVRCTNMTAACFRTPDAFNGLQITEADVSVSSLSGSCSDNYVSFSLELLFTYPSASNWADWYSSGWDAVLAGNAILIGQMTSPLLSSHKALFLILSPMSEPMFLWNDIEDSPFSVDIKSCYDEVVHWRRNVFKVPHSKIGICIVRELARLSGLCWFFSLGIYCLCCYVYAFTVITKTSWKIAS